MYTEHFLYSKRVYLDYFLSADDNFQLQRHEEVGTVLYYCQYSANEDTKIHYVVSALDRTGN